MRSSQTARCDECASPQTRREYSRCFLALCKQVFCFLAFFGFNTVVFLPVALCHRTHTLFNCSKYCREYITLTGICQEGILAPWKRNQNKLRCGSPRKTCKPLRVFENCMGVSPIQRQFAWLCKLWQGKSRPLTHHAPKGRPIPPPLKRRGLSGPFTVSDLGGDSNEVVQ